MSQIVPRILTLCLYPIATIMGTSILFYRCYVAKPRKMILGRVMFWFQILELVTNILFIPLCIWIVLEPYNPVIGSNDNLDRLWKFVTGLSLFRQMGINLSDLEILRTFRVLNSNISEVLINSLNGFCILFHLITRVPNFINIYNTYANNKPSTFMYTLSGLGTVVFGCYCVLYTTVQTIFLVKLIKNSVSKDKKTAANLKLKTVLKILILIIIIDWIGIILYLLTVLYRWDVSASISLGLITSAHLFLETVIFNCLTFTVVDLKRLSVKSKETPIKNTSDSVSVTKQ